MWIDILNLIFRVLLHIVIHYMVVTGLTTLDMFWIFFANKRMRDFYMMFKIDAFTMNIKMLNTLIKDEEPLFYSHLKNTN